MLGRWAGLGSGSCPNSACTATFGVAGPQPAMGLAGARGRAAWVLAGGLLAAALALPAGPRDRGRPPTGPNPLRRPLGAQLPPDPPAAPGAGPERKAQVRSARPDSWSLVQGFGFTHGGGGEAPWGWGNYLRESEGGI